ncbi:hypothetical protein OSB04_020633 [Centaurea solstitialis]|uniref:BZIP domain-containing protein n=1 Tax=Centaurea solstitialis TaxID=347529 RepID=A0AA38WDG2_9ASTR|nr:hypothetical protein OSB04_020633 [Centaurea solstitialis]
MGSNGGGLARQGSLYTLTLDEVQTQLGDLGKPLSSMNLDELLKTVWAVESQPASGLGSGLGLGRQSSLNLTQDLRKRTVDEVWQDIQQGQKKNTTMAGVVKNAGSVIGVEGSINRQQAQWMHYQVPPIQPPPHVYMNHPVQQSLSIGANAMMELAYPETQMTISPSHLMHNLSDTQTPGRKRVASGDVIEKTVERRQKRMIKNRESAARSRARKQWCGLEKRCNVKRDIVRLFDVEQVTDELRTRFTLKRKRKT